MTPPGACIQAPGAKVECTPSSLTPDYQSILDKALEAGLPQSMLPFLPDHIIQTPTVMVVGLVFMFAALPLLLVASLAAWAPQLRIRMSLQVSHWMWWSAMWILFWGWLLCLSISLAQNNQFDHYGESFRAVARVTTKNVTIEGFKHAKLGGSFLQRKCLCDTTHNLMLTISLN